MIDLDRTFFIKKEYISLVTNYFTEEQYTEYIRAVVDYSVFGECEIKSPEVYAAFMYVKYDIDKEKRIIKSNQDNAHTQKKHGRKRKCPPDSLISAIKNEHLTSFEELEKYFDCDKRTIERSLADIEQSSLREELKQILKS